MSANSNIKLEISNSRKENLGVGGPKSTDLRKFSIFWQKIPENIISLIFLELSHSFRDKYGLSNLIFDSALSGVLTLSYGHLQYAFKSK